MKFVCAFADSIDLQLERQEVVPGDIPISVDGELGAVEIEKFNLNSSFSMSDVTVTGHPNSQMTNEKYYSNNEGRRNPDIVLMNVSNTRIATHSLLSVALWDAMTGAQIWRRDGVNGGMCFSECGDFFAFQPTYLGTTAVVIDAFSPGEATYCIEIGRSGQRWANTDLKALSRTGDTVRVAFVRVASVDGSILSTANLRQPIGLVPGTTRLFQHTSLDMVDTQWGSYQMLFYLEKGMSLYLIRNTPGVPVTITCWAVVSGQLLSRYSLSLSNLTFTQIQSHDYLGFVASPRASMDDDCEVTSIFQLQSFTGQPDKKVLEHRGRWFPVHDGFLNIQFDKAILVLKRGTDVPRQLGIIRCNPESKPSLAAVAIGEGCRTWMTLVFKDGTFEFYKRNDLDIWEMVSAQ
jgi:hypothetical protein